MLNNKLSASEIHELAAIHLELGLSQYEVDPVDILRSQRMSKQLVERERIVLILGIDGRIFTGFDALERLPANEWRVYLVSPTLCMAASIDSHDVTRWCKTMPHECEPIGIMCKGRVSDWIDDNDLILYGLSCATRVARQLYCDDFEPAAISSNRPMISSLQIAYSHVRELAHDLEIEWQHTQNIRVRWASDREYNVMERMDMLMDLLSPS